MKKILLISTFAAIATFSNSIFAQAKNFEGFTTGVNLSSIGGTSTFTAGTTKLDLGQQSFVPSIELGYNLAASNEIVFGLTATYDFADSKLGEDSDPIGSLSIKGQNRYSVNLRPGYMVSQNTMAYATVGYNAMLVKVSGDSGVSASKNYSGIGYGLGLAAMLNKNLFIKAEVQQVNFGSQTISGMGIKPNLTIGTIGIGYKF